MMPSHVKTFWWLSVAVVACWVSLDARIMLFPTASRLALDARVAQRDPDFARLSDALFVVEEAVWYGATLGIAWLAAFRHKNWARWLTIVLLLHDPIIWFLIFLGFTPHDAASWAVYAKETQAIWFNPLHSPTRTFSFWASIAAMIFVFSGNARGWFRPPERVP